MEKQNLSTIEMFKDFYEKPYEQITAEDIGPVDNIDWGEDVEKECF